MFKYGSYCPSVSPDLVAKRLSWLVNVLTLFAPFLFSTSMKSGNIVNQESPGAPSQILMNLTWLATLTRKTVYPKFQFNTTSHFGCRLPPGGNIWTKISSSNIATRGQPATETTCRMELKFWEYPFPSYSSKPCNVHQNLRRYTWWFLASKIIHTDRLGRHLYWINPATCQGKTWYYLMNSLFWNHLWKFPFGIYLD